MSEPKNNITSDQKDNFRSKNQTKGVALLTNLESGVVVVLVLVLHNHGSIPAAWNIIWALRTKFHEYREGQWRIIAWSGKANGFLQTWEKLKPARDPIRIR